MPFIPQDERDYLDPFIDDLVAEIETKGQRTYSVYYLAFSPNDVAGSYTAMSNALSVLSDAYIVLKDELLAYERKKKLENGGIYGLSAIS